MNLFLLRLDILPVHHTRPNLPIGPDAAVGSDVECGGGIRPVFEISSDDRTTFADLSRTVVETRFLGGNLLEYLERNGRRGGRDGGGEHSGRHEFYVLKHSEEDATVLRPYWSSCPPARSFVGEEALCGAAVHHFMLQFSFGKGSDEKLVEPATLVSTFLSKNPPEQFADADGIECSNSEMKRRKICRDGCIDMKLTIKFVHGAGSNWRPKKVNVLLCEEHWRHKCKLCPWNMLCTPKNPSLLTSKRSETSSKRAERHHVALKSCLILGFFESNLLKAIAFLIPTSLILGGLDAFDGIQLSVDKPSFCRVRSINLERPAVLRQYFGADINEPMDLHRHPDSGDTVWRWCYGAGSGSRSVGIHPRHFRTRGMTLAMTIIASKIYHYLQKRFDGDGEVVVRPFNHVTVLFYYQKLNPREDDRKPNNHMLGYHTDNVYSHDGIFAHDSNSQMENTFTALLTLGDGRELHFRRQEIPDGKKEWMSDDSDDTLSFFMEHGSLFLLHPNDEKPTRTNNVDEAIHRFQHAVRFPHYNKLSTALAFRTVTSKELVYKDTGTLFAEPSELPPMLPPPPPAISSNNDTEPEEPELDFLLDNFRNDNLIAADQRLKKLWLSVCDRHFQFQTQKQAIK